MTHGKKLVWGVGVSALVAVAAMASCSQEEDAEEGPPPCESVYEDLCGTPCSADTDCEPGLFCSAAGQCTADCADGARGCGDGICTDDGRCIGAGCGLDLLSAECDVPCTSDRDCAGGVHCGLNGVCTADCTPNGPGCGDGNVCTDRGRCVDGTGSLIDSGTISDAPFDACTGLSYEQELQGGPLDIYLIFDRTASMGDDCDYVAGQGAPVNSKACFATYAMCDYVSSVNPATDTRLAFQFMSLADDCDSAPYATPLVGLTPLPVPTDHEIIQEISAEQFQGGFGTRIEAALNGIATFTANNVTPGREMIGVLMTDGEPNGCEGDVDNLADIIANHLSATGIRTFIIGMEGAQNGSLETMGSAGGAVPHDDYCAGGPTPCHYWNVGDGSGDAIAAALTAIIGQAAPLPCEFDVANLQAPAGETVDYGKVNVWMADETGTESPIGQVSSVAACPGDQLAWYYDNPDAPTRGHLCPTACDAVSAAATGSELTVILGCQDTIVLPE
jgi:hypothetical protein